MKTKNLGPEQKHLRTNFRFGFTLIELLVVVLIIGILFAVALPQYNKAVYKARMKESETIMDSIYKGGTLYKLANGSTPEKFEDMTLGLPAGCAPGDGYGIATNTCLDKMTCGHVTYCLTDYGVVTSFAFNKGFCTYCHFNKHYSTGAFVCRVVSSEISTPSFFYQYCKDMGYSVVREGGG